MKEPLQVKKKRVLGVLRRLRKVYPGTRCPLKCRSPWELLVATILSAQCTDKRVNMVTPSLFEKFPDVCACAQADPEVFARYVRSTGFYRNKTKNILGAARTVIERFGGEVPSRMEDLVTLPGVGRKTANVILGNAFGVPGLSVDTHMIRLNRLLGFTRHRDPVKIEFDLMELVPRKNWTEYSSLIIRHGRECCFARRPDCPRCPLQTLCPSVKP
ncbi:MAG: endonuclease III [Candidatus Omnitrophica bacterium]|nr:endonuclease III [Candidatus Omnitrophota bacterium]